MNSYKAARTAGSNIGAELMKDIIHYFTASRWYQFEVGDISFEGRRRSGRSYAPE